MIIGLKAKDGVASLARQLIYDKHTEYAKSAKVYRAMYYTARLVAGLSAGLLPFVVGTSVAVATGLSVAIVVVTVFDLVFAPKDKWKLYSRAADLLTMQRLKDAGEFEQCKEMLNLLVATENAKLEQLVNLDELLSKVNQQHSK